MFDLDARLALAVPNFGTITSLRAADLATTTASTLHSHVTTPTVLRGSMKFGDNVFSETGRDSSSLLAARQPRESGMKTGVVS